MAENIDTGPLPPGWDRKYDHRTGKYYFINYFNKTTTWEDPRYRYRQLAQGTPQHMPSTAVMEAIPLQHGSPDLRGYHIYPSNSSYYPPQPAFQNPAPYSHTSIHFQDMTNSRPSPKPGRSFAHQVVSPFGSPARFVETSLISDPEQSVAKISAMFPTVQETHIRALLIKYHNREAVVMSALQVEKHPLSTPGPYSTPPLAGRHFGVYSALQMTPPLGLRGSETSRTGSPVPRPGSGGSGSCIGSPRIGDTYQRPHSSPKMKLRYLKSVFPKADENLLLDALNNSDNNVQKASEMLITMGFEKRDTPPPRLTLRKKEEEAKALLDKQMATPIPPPRMKSHEEKQKMKARLQEQYVDIPERVVTIALDSVDYDEERAGQILQIMVQEDSKTELRSKSEASVESAPVAKPTPVVSVTKVVSETKVVAPQEEPPCSPSKEASDSALGTPEKSDKVQAKRTKGKKDIPKVSRGTSTTEDKEYKSPYLLKVCGPSHDLYKGPNDDILLSEYITWNGPNPELLSKSGAKASIAKGPNKSLLKGTSILSKGPNIAFWKGPTRGLAKGSIYSQLTSKNLANESRGK